MQIALRFTSRPLCPQANSLQSSIQRSEVHSEGDVLITKSHKFVVLQKLTAALLKAGTCSCRLAVTHMSCVWVTFIDYDLVTATGLDTLNVLRHFFQNISIQPFAAQFSPPTKHFKNCNIIFSTLIHLVSLCCLNLKVFYFEIFNIILATLHYIGNITLYQ